MKCPNCGDKMVCEAGCYTCYSCYFSYCDLYKQKIKKIIEDLWKIL